MRLDTALEKMMNEKIITESGNFIASADKWGTMSITVFFVIIFLLLVFGLCYFMRFLLSEIKRSVDENTRATKDNAALNKEIARSIGETTENTIKNREVVGKISNRQDEIHENVKEILQITRSKGI